MKSAVPALCLLLLACHPSSGTPDDTTLYNGNRQEEALSPGVQPVRIGETGAAFAACAAVGTVTDLSPGGQAYLPLRAAPFAEGKELARLANGQSLVLCTRSLDQRWQGVVVPDANGGDCGVSNPVAAPEAYAGPCQSGWVSSAFVRVRAN
ncbi:hypothetical protein [Sphingomonas immobilis]|uniref:Integron n=1 Tax=Sphingomonas immobilis TaxID=3063997 RepID=A0ABT9A552_9SPHN|nr:hypothetical protein [Sphingomonas sp. CA1-15]MDO7844474.1 hypothetical protein [Sphingomonas sp. CA1-15]